MFESVVGGDRVLTFTDIQLKKQDLLASVGLRALLGGGGAKMVAMGKW